MVGDDDEHRRRILVLQPQPAHLLVGDAVLADVILAGRKDPPLHRLARPVGAVLLGRMRLVQAADEQEIGDLLDYLDRIGDAARPERIPHIVDLGPKYPVRDDRTFAGTRRLRLCSSTCPTVAVRILGRILPAMAGRCRRIPMPASPGSTRPRASRARSSRWAAGSSLLECFLDFSHQGMREACSSELYEIT